MPGVYNSLISRSDVDVFMPEEVAAEVIQSAVASSAALRLFPSTPMSTKTRRVPVLSTLPVAYFVNGDTGLKQTTEMAWGGKFLEAEEIACIVPIPEAVLDDADHDLWGEVRPRIAEAIGRTLDAAIFFGTNKPATWPNAIVPDSTAAGNVYVRGTNTADKGGIAADVSALFTVVESDGFEVAGLVARGTYKGFMRNARDANGVLLSEVTGGTIYGVPLITDALRGFWPAGVSKPEAIAGDFNMGRIGVRQDLTYKILDQAVITDDTGTIIYNLPQQDMLALRVVARYAFQVANPLTYESPVEANRYPFAVMNGPAT